MIKTIIVDDDSLQIESLVAMLNEHFKRVEIIATSENVNDAVRKINKLQPQLVFLDIQMGSLSGFDLLEMVNERDFEVIFTTYYNEYALQALKATALDFIEKPVNIAKLAEALQKYKERTGKLRMENLLANFKATGEEQKIALPEKNFYKFFEVNKIIRCQSDNSNTEFYIFDESEKTKKCIKIVVTKGLYYYEDFLVGKGFFFRVHKQHLVNISHIKKYIRDENGYLVMDDNSGAVIPVARARKEDFLIYLKSKGIIL